MITYAKLLEKLKKMTPEQLRMTVTVHIAADDEYYGVNITFKVFFSLKSLNASLADSSSSG